MSGVEAIRTQQTQTRPMNENYDNSQWPPPPNFGPGDDTHSSGLKPLARLLTGSTRGDTGFGIALSVTLFTLLIFTLTNPFTASVLPPPTKFPIGLRLLTGWFFASGVQYAAWKLFLAHDFQVVCNSIILTAFPTATIWLSLSLLAWMFG